MAKIFNDADHDDTEDAKAIAIPQVFSENSRVKNGVSRAKGSKCLKWVYVTQNVKFYGV